VICPRCGKKELQEILCESEPIDYCTQCHGSWLDKGEAKAFTAFPERVLRSLQTDLIDTRRSPIRCPRCGGAMTEGGLFQPDYRLDRCNDCGGVWFDSRELSRLQKIAPADPPTPAPPRPAPAGPTAKPRRPAPSRTEINPRAPTVSAVCPRCGTAPRPGDRWQCTCSGVFDPFPTGGRCPRCGRNWGTVKCAECGRWSPIGEWLGR